MKDKPVFGRTDSWFLFRLNWAASGLLLVFLLLGALMPGCERVSNKVPAEVEQTVERVKEQVAPDPRFSLFEMELQRRGDQIVVLGEVTEARAKAVLMDSLQRYGDRFEIVDNVLVLPEPALEPEVYGIVDVTVANQRREAKHQSELVNQAPYGAVVKLFKTLRGFIFVRNWDGYLGWMSKTSFQRVDSLRAARWLSGKRLIVTGQCGRVFSRPGGGGDLLARLVPGSVLLQRGRKGAEYEVELPNGRVGYVPARLVAEEERLARHVPTRQEIVRTARSFLHVPYLWGGSTTYGFDCSGLVQTVFRLNSIRLPRDANQMVLEGVAIDPGEHFEHVLPGDLLFFGPQPDRITHVAISLGGARFIHSDGEVHINSLDPDDPLFNAYRRQTFRLVKRILEDR